VKTGLSHREEALLTVEMYWRVRLPQFEPPKAKFLMGWLCAADVQTIHEAIDYVADNLSTGYYPATFDADAAGRHISVMLKRRREQFTTTQEGTTWKKH
jgi:hypothetical protein